MVIKNPTRIRIGLKLKLRLFKRGGSRQAQQTTRKAGRKGGGNPPSVGETSFPTFLDSKICAIDGTNLRQLRDGLGICSPGIIIPEEWQSETFWKAIGKSLLEIRNPDILTSEQIRSADLLKVLREKFLDKGCEN